MSPHHKLTGEDLLITTVEDSESLEEPQDAVHLFHSGILCEGLLNHLPQLLGLPQTQTNNQ